MAPKQNVGQSSVQVNSGLGEGLHQETEASSPIDNESIPSLVPEDSSASRASASQPDSMTTQQLLDRLMELAFPVHEHSLLDDPVLIHKTGILSEKIVCRMKDITALQKKGFASVHNLISGICMYSNANRENKCNLEAFKFRHQEALLKFRASKEKLLEVDKDLGVAEAKLAAVEFEMVELQAQIQQCTSELEICRQRRNDSIKELEVSFEENIELLKQISVFEETRKVLNAKHDKLKTAYGEWKLNPPF